MIFSSDTIIDFGVRIDMFYFFYVWYCFAKSIYLKKDIFKICFQQSAKCKMTHKLGDNIMCVSKSAIYICILPSKLRFSSSDHFFVFSVQLIHFTGGVFPVYTIHINISNIYKRSRWVNKLRKRTLNDLNRYGKLRKLTLNDVNRYGKLRKLTVNYVSRHGKLRKQVIWKRQNFRRGFR